MKIGKKTLVSVLMLIFVVSTAVMIAESLGKKESEEQYQELREEVMKMAEPTVTEVLINEEVPDERVPEEPLYQAPEGLIDLMEANPYIVGWIKIDGTNIDYPVAQNREDNEWFLHRDINGSKSQPGSIYLDSNHDMNEKGIHTVYGHRMKNGTMFKDISRFTDGDYLKNHKDITIWTEEQMIKLEPVYCYVGEADGSYRNVLDSGKELESFLLEKTGLNISSDNVFVFITCSYEQKDGRCYLICSGVE